MVLLTLMLEPLVRKCDCWLFIFPVTETSELPLASKVEKEENRTVSDRSCLLMVDHVAEYTKLNFYRV